MKHIIYIGFIGIFLLVGCQAFNNGLSEMPLTNSMDQRRKNILGESEKDKHQRQVAGEIRKEQEKLARKKPQPTDIEIVCTNIERVADVNIEDPKKLLDTWLFLDDYLVYKDKGNALFAKTWENPDTDMLNLGPQLIPADKREKWLEATQKLLTPEQKKKHLYILYETTEDCSSYKIQELRKRILSHYLPQEKALFKKRSGDRKMGYFMLHYFMISNNREKPQENNAYIYKEYPTMEMRIVQSVEGGVLVRGKFLSKVEQIYAGGDLDRPVLIKTTQKYVDDSALAEGYYAYIGLKEYINVLGVNRTVYAFEEIPNLKVNDLLFYKGE